MHLGLLTRIAHILMIRLKGTWETIIANDLTNYGRRRMPQAFMPPGQGRLADAEGVLDRGWRRKRVQPTLTATPKKSFLGFLILNQTEVGVKFHEGRIIGCEARNRNKIFLSFGNMQYVI